MTYPNRLRPAKGNGLPRFDVVRRGSSAWCGNHKKLASFDTPFDALLAAMDPGSWCEGCAAILDAEESRGKPS